MTTSLPSGHTLSPSGSWGMELKADTTRDGFIDDGNIAWPERIVEARRQWTQARAEEFEKVGRRRWRDRASGVEYREEDGSPLLSIGTDAVRNLPAVVRCMRASFIEQIIAFCK